MSTNTSIAVPSNLHVGIGVGLSGGTGSPTIGDLLQEDGVSFFLVENGSGIIELE